MGVALRRSRCDEEFGTGNRPIEKECVALPLARGGNRLPRVATGEVHETLEVAPPRPRKPSKMRRWSMVEWCSGQDQDSKERSRRSERCARQMLRGASLCFTKSFRYLTKNGGTVLNLIIGLFRGFVFPYISRIHTALGIKFQVLLHVTLNITRVHVDYHHFQPLLGWKVPPHQTDKYSQACSSTSNIFFAFDMAFFLLVFRDVGEGHIANLQRNFRSNHILQIYHTHTSTIHVRPMDPTGYSTGQ